MYQIQLPDCCTRCIITTPEVPTKCSRQTYQNSPLPQMSHQGPDAPSSQLLRQARCFAEPDASSEARCSVEPDCSIRSLMPLQRPDASSEARTPVRARMLHQKPERPSGPECFIRSQNTPLGPDAPLGA
ncbi:hypothetical protein ISN44_As12g023380 [Arabidopsis suecica]|uniref:Uncharacterized protein n=1 Tax=Arabidopsis suecica TaxID=45249 RepID=A0A8T1YM20_ARASU|nr:hypothetical protein ISN44_As12g023380 [Arabidopsis suecica]